ncbi:MAG: BglII/BstYI family type II restriction endonuclease [Steroidobacteraceae bacterium]
MSVELLPEFIRTNYEVHEWKHACAILKEDFPNEWLDIQAVLSEFRLRRSWIQNPGGSKSEIAAFIDHYLTERGWVEKEFKTQVVVDEKTMDSPTHKVDCFRNRVALEIEWNNKDPFFDRDLNNFRLLFDLRAISVGVIITRCDDLQDIFKLLGRGSSYGASTTHMGKLLPRIKGGSGAGCPLLVFGISKSLFVED